VAVSVAGLEYDDLIRLGRVLREVGDENIGRLAIIASADFSRREKAAPGSERPTPVEKQIARAITQRKISELPAVKKDSVCGLSPVIVMLSAIDGISGQSKIISTEAPYGIGYITAWLDV
jgi:AmmeMemoRadiSam system protein B